MVKIDYRKQKYQAEYKDLKFNSKKQFEDWLNSMTEYRVKFVDKGQDCLEWFLDIGGEVLHSNLHSSIWNGQLVDLYSLKIGKNIEIMEVEKRRNRILDFVIKKLNKYRYEYNKKI